MVNSKLLAKFTAKLEKLNLIIAFSNIYIDYERFKTY